MKQTLIIAFISLVIGGGAGYLIGGSKTHPGTLATPEITNSMHGGGSDAMLQDLRTRSGSGRDQAFLESMILHHESAVEMANLILESTRRPELEQLAENIITAQNAEIAQMKSWLSDWYGR